MLRKHLILLLCTLTLAACGGGQPDTTQSVPSATSTAAAPAAAATLPPVAQAAAPTTSSVAPATTVAPAEAASASADEAPAEQKQATTEPVVAPADTGKWVAGTHYFVLQPQQPRLDESDKHTVEVVEVFSYGCPACSHAQPYMRKLAKSLPAGAVMEHLPVAFRPDENFPLYQRAFYTAQVFGVAEKAHDAMFDATWKTGETATYDTASGRPKPKAQWPDIGTMAKFYAQYGVDPQQFVATSQSFAVNMKMKRADQLVKSWQVDSTPSVVIDGKYRFTARSAGGYEQMIEMTQWLVQKERHDLQQEH